MIGLVVFTTGNILFGLGVALVVSVLLTANNTVKKPILRYPPESKLLKSVYHSGVFLTGVVVFMVPSCLIVLIVMLVVSWSV